MEVYMRKLMIVFALLLHWGIAQEIRLPLAGTLSDNILVIANEPKGADESFALAMLHFLQSFEGLGQAWHRYGLREDRRNAFVLSFNLPSTSNPEPENLGYADLRTVLEEFLANLTKANAELEPLIANDQIASFYLEPNRLVFDINNDGIIQEDEDFHAVLQVLSMSNLQDFEGISNVQEIRFDTADIYWLSAYANLFSFVAELILAHDSSLLFESTAQYFFPTIDTPTPLPLNITSDFGIDSELADIVAILHLVLRVPLLEEERMLHSLNHLQDALRLSQKSWGYILNEDDDVAEWIPNPNQHSAMGVRLTMEQITGWNAALADIEAVAKGELLIPHWRFTSQGFNVHTYFTQPTTFDLVLLLQGAGAFPYMEKGELITGESLMLLNDLFEGNAINFGFWLN